MINPGNVPTSRFLRDAGIERGMRVLDIGCANGTLSREIAQLVGKEGHVLGVDCNESMLVDARDHITEADCGSIAYENVDLAGNFPSWDSFDIIVGRRIMMYLPDVKEVMSRLTGLLKPNGFILFHEHSATGLPFAAQPIPYHKQIHDWMWRTIAAEKGTITMGLDLPKLFRESGLTVDHYRAEAIILDSSPDGGIEDVANYMVRRIVDAGIADMEAIGPDSLTERLTNERCNLDSPIVWDMAYLINGKKCR